MDRSRISMLAVLFAAPAAFAAPHHKKAAATPAATPTPPAGKTPAREFDMPDQPPEPTAGAHTEGEYGGVDPAHPNTAKPEAGHKTKKPPAKGTLAWIGFEAKSGGADVFFQSVAPFELAQHVENGTLVVELSGLDRLGQQTWRPIDAHFFDSPVARISAKRVGAARASKTGAGHGAGIEVRIAFKNAKDAHEGTTRSATEADGMYYAYLSFAGSGDSTSTVQEPEK